MQQAWHTAAVKTIDDARSKEIIRALGKHFPNYEVYAADASNLLLVAMDEGEPSRVRIVISAQRAGNWWVCILQRAE